MDNSSAREREGLINTTGQSSEDHVETREDATVCCLNAKRFNICFNGISLVHFLLVLTGSIFMIVRHHIDKTVAYSFCFFAVAMTGLLGYRIKSCRNRELRSSEIMITLSAVMCSWAFAIARVTEKEKEILTQAAAAISSFTVLTLVILIVIKYCMDKPLFGPCCPRSAFFMVLDVDTFQDLAKLDLILGICLLGVMAPVDPSNGLLELSWYFVSAMFVKLTGKLSDVIFDIHSYKTKESEAFQFPSAHDAFIAYFTISFDLYTVLLFTLGRETPTPQEQTLISVVAIPLLIIRCLLLSNVYLASSKAYAVDRQKGLSLWEIILGREKHEEDDSSSPSS